jgi:hypothetical protein
MKNPPSPSEPAVWPDLGKLDSAKAMLMDAGQLGYIEEMRGLLGLVRPDEKTGRLRTLRDVAFELAAFENRDFAVDLLVYITGAFRYGADDLREFGVKHGCSHEWFRQQAVELKERLFLVDDQYDSSKEDVR